MATDSSSIASSSRNSGRHLRVAFESAAFEYIDDALRNIDERRGRRLCNAEMRDEAARGAAMRDRNGIALKALVPRAHPNGDRLIAFPAGRHEVPFVMLARGDALRIARVQLCD